VRRYVISELDVAAAADPEPPAHELVTFAERRASPRRSTRSHRLRMRPARAQRDPDRRGVAPWGLERHPADTYFIALDGDRVLGYGYLEHEGEEWQNGFMAVRARGARPRVAGAIKRAQIAWAKANGVPTLRTANEVRLESMLALNRRFATARSTRRSSCAVLALLKSGGA